MKSIYWLEFGIFIDCEKKFNSWDIYKKIKLKPIYCKMFQKESIELLNKNWKEDLNIYAQSPTDNYISNNQELVPMGFYKITSAIFYEKDIQKCIHHFMQKFFKKQIQLKYLKEVYNGFFTFKIVGRNCDCLEFFVSKTIIDFCSKNNIIIQVDYK